MFTGIIEEICSVKSVSGGSGTMTLVVDLGRLAEDAHIGDSIAVSGVCLTITALRGSSATFEASSETLAKSTLGKLRPNSSVNVERALRADGRFGGHFVLGHVDGAAKTKSIQKQGRFAELTFEAPQQLLDQIVPKGSVAIDGISLTVAEMDEKTFTVAVIPETLGRTTLGSTKIGDTVNIETDLIVKSIVRQLGRILPQKQELTVEKLREMGY
jgi:riboflavin synthase